MDSRQDLFRSLLDGMAEDERRSIVGSIERARHEQLTRKVDPPRRRRRNSDGELELRPRHDGRALTGSGDVNHSGG